MRLGYNTMHCLEASRELKPESGIQTKGSALSNLVPLQCLSVRPSFSSFGIGNISRLLLTLRPWQHPQALDRPHHPRPWRPKP